MLAQLAAPEEHLSSDGFAMQAACRSAADAAAGAAAAAAQPAAAAAGKPDPPAADASAASPAGTASSSQTAQEETLQARAAATQVLLGRLMGPAGAANAPTSPALAPRPAHSGESAHSAACVGTGSAASHDREGSPACESRGPAKRGADAVISDGGSGAGSPRDGYASPATSDSEGGAATSRRPAAGGAAPATALQQPQQRQQPGQPAQQGQQASPLDSAVSQAVSSAGEASPPSGSPRGKAHSTGTGGTTWPPSPQPPQQGHQQGQPLPQVLQVPQQQPPPPQQPAQSAAQQVTFQQAPHQQTLYQQTQPQPAPQRQGSAGSPSSSDGGIADGCNGGVGAAGGDGEEERRVARMMRNRESAQMSRQRKKMHADEVERRCTELQTHNSQLAGVYRGMLCLAFTDWRSHVRLVAQFLRVCRLGLTTQIQSRRRCRLASALVWEPAGQHLAETVLLMLGRHQQSDTPYMNTLNSVVQAWCSG